MGIIMYLSVSILTIKNSTRCGIFTNTQLWLRNNNFEHLILRIFDRIGDPKKSGTIKNFQA